MKVTLKGHNNEITALLYINNNILSASLDSTIRVWNTKKYECIEVFTGHTGAVNCLALLSGNDFASGSSDKTVKIWHEFICISTIIEQRYITCLRTDQSGNLLSASNCVKYGKSKKAYRLV
jgi:WD40 repeat protein